ncbi:hypothetical protein [Stenotrophomonas rhizophila]
MSESANRNAGETNVLLAHCPLAVATALALLLPFQAWGQQVIADGVSLQPPGGTYITTAPVDIGTTAGYAFYALNLGGINPLDPVTLVTHGRGAAAAHAQGEFSLINFAGVLVQTFGESAAGLSTTDGGHIRAVGGMSWSVLMAWGAMPPMPANRP